jgi:hypothetical protein
MRKIKHLSKNRRQSIVIVDEAQESWQDAKSSLKRIFTNKIFVLNMGSAWVTMFFFSGFGTFMAKFYQV